MPYTSHGHWYGETEPTGTEARPSLVARCGGPGLCPDCARQAIVQPSTRLVADDSHYRTGRHNRQELVYFQPDGVVIEHDGQLRFVIAKGPVDGPTLVRALNTPQALEILRAAEQQATEV